VGLDAVLDQARINSQVNGRVADDLVAGNAI
jgi:hypothetical protein